MLFHAPPRNVMPTIITYRSITVTWDTITCIERNGIITSYTVEFGSSGNPTMRTGITALTFTANGLTPFTNYTFQVAGVNSVNTGMYSNIISITTNEASKHACNSILLAHILLYFLICSFSSRSCAEPGKQYQVHFNSADLEYSW